MYIYNVWNDDLSVDAWVYDPAVAMVIRGEALFESNGEEVNVTRYEEDEHGNVNVHTNFMRMDHRALLEAIASDDPECK